MEPFLEKAPGGLGRPRPRRKRPRLFHSNSSALNSGVGQGQGSPPGSQWQCCTEKGQRHMPFVTEGGAQGELPVQRPWPHHLRLRLRRSQGDMGGIGAWPADWR